MNKKQVDMLMKVFMDDSEDNIEWRDIEGYEGLYQVSEDGDIMSVGYKKKRLLKQYLNVNGYPYVSLYKNGERKHYTIHRLVATAFCENTNGFDEVNHIDEVKTNNHYSNLEWCSRQYNVNYGTRNERAAEERRRKIKCIELNIVFDSLTQAAKYVNTHNSNISACASGKKHTCKGYHWEYVD